MDDIDDTAQWDAIDAAWHNLDLEQQYRLLTDDAEYFSWLNELEKSHECTVKASH